VDAPRFPNRATVRLSDALHLRLAALMARTEVYADEVQVRLGRSCSPRHTLARRSVGSVCAVTSIYNSEWWQC
jgi:hypothetical protein